MSVLNKQKVVDVALVVSHYIKSVRRKAGATKPEIIVSVHQTTDQRRNGLTCLLGLVSDPPVTSSKPELVLVGAWGD